MSDVVFSVEVAKAAGRPTDDFYSANLEEKPTEAEKLEHRGHLFLVVSLKVQNPAGKTVELADLAHGFWSQVSSKFYEDLSGGVLAALTQAASIAKEKLLTQISPTESGFVATSIWGKILYLVCFGAAGAGLVRKNKFSQILQSGDQPGEILSASGFLEDGDVVFLATASFFAEVENLPKYSAKTIFQIEEEVTSKITQSPNPEAIAATVIKIREAAQIAQAEIVSFAEADKLKTGFAKVFLPSKLFVLLEKLLSQFRVIFSNTLTGLFESFAKVLPKRGIYLEKDYHKLTRKRLFTILLAVLISILVVSLSFGIWQKQRKLQAEKFEEFFGKSQTLYEQSIEISSINRLKAAELLAQAEKNLVEAKKFKFDKQKVAELTEKINAAKSQALKIVKVDNPNLIFDFILVKANAQISEIEKFTNILAFDNKNPTLFTLDLVSKTGQITSGGEGFSGFANFATSGNFVYFLKSADGIYQLDLTSTELKKVINKADQWGDIADLASFSGNLYLLDGAADQIWKYTAGAGGFSQISGFLKQPGANFTSGSFAIDGFIWVMAADGKLYQATPTEAKLIEISGLDKPLSSKTIIRTNETAENLYIADLGNSRILVISKSGLYSAQYTSGVFGNLADFAVDEKEGKVYFAAGSKVFQFDLVK